MSDIPSTSAITQFNKFINLRFWLTNPPSAPADIEIITPKPLPYGVPFGPTSVISMQRKPEIEISGTFVDEVACPGLSIRVTNLATEIPLWQYEDHMMEIEVGYQSSMKTALKLKGRIMTASMEKPSPDSVTVFSLWLGNLTALNTQLIHEHYSSKSGATVGTVLYDVASAMSDDYFQYIVYGDHADGAMKIPLQGAFDYSGTINNMLTELKRAYGLSIMIFQDQIRVIRENHAFSADTFDLTYVTSITRHAGAFTIKAPWTPGITPNTLIEFDPRYYKQTLGGAAAPSPPKVKQRVLTVDFAFSTVGKTNTMTLMTLGDV